MSSGFGGLAFAGGAFAVPTGALLDRYDPHAVFASGVLLRAVSVGATPLCARLWQVNLLAVAQGVTLPLIGVSIRVCLVRAVGKDRCAAALNFTMGAFGLASILAPVAYAALVRAFADSLGAAVAWHWGPATDHAEALAEFELDLAVGGVRAGSPPTTGVGGTRPYYRGHEAVGAPPISSNQLRGNQVCTAAAITQPSTSRASRSRNSRLL